MYDYTATLIRVVDGDTLHLAVDLGCDITINLTIRLAGVDCPELSTVEGKAARDFTAGWFAAADAGAQLQLLTTKDRREKYGRYLGTVLYAAGGPSLNDALVINGHAKAYAGGARKP